MAETPGFLPDDKAWEEAHLALGQFLSAWGDVENRVAMLFRAIAVPDRRIASVIFRHMSTRSQIEMLIDLVKQVGVTTDGGKLVRLLERVVDASGRRNSIVHGHWSMMTPPPKLYRVSQAVTEARVDELIAGIKGRHEHQRYKARNAFSLTELRSETTRMKALGQELLAEYRALSDHPSLDTQP